MKLYLEQGISGCKDVVKIDFPLANRRYIRVLKIATIEWE
jgi:hypothetical protein